jgi:O-antigen/teichoic acid export membrane protein
MTSESHDYPDRTTAGQAAEAAIPPAFVNQDLKKLLKHSSHYLAGLVASLVLGLISFPIFTRVFPVAAFGLIDLAQKVLLLSTAGAKAGLQNAALRFYDHRRFAGDSAAAQTYFSTMLFGVLATSGTVAVLFVAVVGLSPSSLIGAPIAGLLWFLAALIILRAAGAMLWAFLRVEERTKAFNASAIGTKAATIAAVCALLPWTGATARTYFAGVTAVEAALVVVLALPLLWRGTLAPLRCDLRLFRASASFGLPLVAYESAFTLLGSADRFLVRHHLGADALGYYSVAYGLAQHVNELLITPLNLAFMPICMRLWTTEGREKTIQFLSVSMKLYLMAAGCIFAVGAASARDTLILLASSKYAGAERLIPVLLAGLLIYTLHVFVAAGLFIHGRTLQMAGILLGCVALNIGMNWLLLPRLGLSGAAVSGLASYALCIAILAWASHRVLPVRIGWLPIARYVVAGAGAWLAGSAVTVRPPIMNIPARSLIAVVVYAGILLAIDSRARSSVSGFYRNWSKTTLRQQGMHAGDLARLP